MAVPDPSYRSIRIVRAAFRELQRLSYQYSETVARILRKMSQGDLGDHRQLKGYRDLSRTRSGDIRVIWTKNESNEILIIKAGLRGDVYQGVFEDRYRTSLYTLANLLGIEESQLEDIPTFNFNVNGISSWYQFIYGTYLYSPHLTQEQRKLSEDLLEKLRSYSYRRYSEFTNINSCLLQSAPGTGKTVSAALIASEFYQNNNCNVVFILPENLCSEIKEYTEIQKILQHQPSNFFIGSFAEWLCQSAPELYQLVATSSEELQALQAEAQRVHAISGDELLQYKDLILFRAFILARDEVYQSSHPNYNDNKPRIDLFRDEINLSRFRVQLGNKQSWLEGVKEITTSILPLQNQNTTLFILDEAQDYLRYEITTIIEMLKRWQVNDNHNPILWILGDKNQNIMPTDFDWGQLELTKNNSLRYNYRNTKYIIEFANIFQSFAQQSNRRHLPKPSNPEDAFEKGEPVKILEFGSEEKALEILNNLSKKIINPFSSNQRSLLKEISSRVKVICKDIPDKYKNLPGIDYLNIQQAKGREFDGCIALCVLGGQGTPSFEEATSWYTTFTRPRYRLLVIATTEEIKRIGKDKFNQCENIQLSNVDEALNWITEFANGEQIFRNIEGVSNVIYDSLNSDTIRIFWDTYAALRLARIDDTKLAEIEYKAIQLLAKNHQRQNILQEFNLLQPEQVPSDSDRIPLRCLLLRSLGLYWDAVKEASLLKEIDTKEYERIILAIANELEKKQLIYEAARVRMKIGISIPKDYPFREEIIKQDSSLVSLLCYAAIKKIKEYR